MTKASVRRWHVNQCIRHLPPELACCSELGLAHAGEDALGGYQEEVIPPAHCCTHTLQTLVPKAAELGILLPDL